MTNKTKKSTKHCFAKRTISGVVRAGAKSFGPSHSRRTDARSSERPFRK